jgi:hypothetical protein
MVKDSNAPSRPMGAFFRYCNANRAKVTKQTGLTSTKLSSVLGERWKNLSDAQKLNWKGNFDAEMEQYRVKMEAYKQTDNYKKFQKAKLEKKFKKKAPKDLNAPKRPLSGYILFSNAKRLSVSKNFPTLSFTELGSKLASMWRDLGESQKAVWTGKSAKAKEKYQVQLARYHETDKYKEFCEQKANFQKSKERAKFAVQGKSVPKKAKKVVKK